VGSKCLTLAMEEGQAMIEGLGCDVGDFDNASYWHLVDQQFENGFVLMMIPLPSGGLSVPGECFTTDVATPAGVTNRLWVANS
jgi:hypothetical protein